MKRAIIYLSVVILYACSPPPQVVTTEIVTVRMTSTPEPANNTIPTETFTPGSSPTFTLEPTATYTATPTPLPELAGFEAEVMGDEDRGAYLLLNYLGEPSDLEGLTFAIQVKFKNRRADGFRIENPEANLDLELLDSKYTTIDDNKSIFGPIDILVNVYAADGDDSQVLVDKVEMQAEQREPYRFIHNIFPNNLHIEVTTYFHDEHKAIDLITSTNSVYPFRSDIPVNSPVSGLIVKSGLITGWGKQNKIIIWDPETGYIVALVHVDQYTQEGKSIASLPRSIEAGTPLSFIGPQDYRSTGQHIHMEVLKPLRYPEEDQLDGWQDAVFWMDNIDDSRSRGVPFYSLMLDDWGWLSQYSQ